MSPVKTATTRSRALLVGGIVLCAALVLGLLFLQGTGPQSGAQTPSTTSTGPGGPAAAEPSPDPSPTRTGVLPTPVPPTPQHPGPSPTRAATTTPTAEPNVSGTPVSGLATIAESQLPPEAWDTMQLIYDGGPFPYRQDDETFFNREGILPDRARGYYREYTVETPGWHDRGARRIVAGEEGDLYYTEDHYDSFRQIEERT
ncbi:MAG: ribonuclease domain-containing protein [Actinomycetia bacterium]|nr:ribonuclease domain-containing protein [Actinomycetes bacterium]